MAVNGAALALVTGGGILIWSGLAGVTPLQLTKALAGGQGAPQIHIVAPTTILSNIITKALGEMGSAIGSAVSGAIGGISYNSGGAGGSGASPVGSGAGGAAPSALGSSIAAAARAHLGAPYVWGGADPSGWDCSGMVTWILHHQMGLELPDDGHTTSQQFLVWSGAQTVDASQAQAGDLVCWITHIAVATGPDTCIGAEDERLGTIEGHMATMGPGGETYRIRRVLPQAREMSV